VNLCARPDLPDVHWSPFSTPTGSFLRGTALIQTTDRAQHRGRFSSTPTSAPRRSSSDGGDEPPPCHQVAYNEEHGITPETIVRESPASPASRSSLASLVAPPSGKGRGRMSATTEPVIAEEEMYSPPRSSASSMPQLRDDQGASAS
jgi:hypothetical protein